MKRFIGFVGDRLQAIFPPNRLAILLAGPILAASTWISGFVAANVPGVELPTGVIAGVMGATALITIRLLDRWFDQWQRGEPIQIDHDLDAALDELTDSPEVHDLYSALGTMQVVHEAIADVEDRIHGGTINEAEVAKSLEAIGGAVRNFLAEHLEPEDLPPVPAPVPPTPADAAEHVPPGGVVPVAAPPGAPAGPPANAGE